MKYHLQKFDNLIKNGNRGEIEAGQIIQEIKESAFSFRTETELTLFVQNHQIQLHVFRNVEAIREQADEVIFFLETHFSKFVDEELPISDRGWTQFWNSYSKTIIDAKEIIIKDIGRKLCSLVAPLTEPDKQDIQTIYNIKYLTSFWRNWPQSESFKVLNEEKLISYLISQNYNPPAFFKFVTGGILSELYQDDDPLILSQILNSYSHKLNTILSRKGKPFSTEYEDIKPLLDDWLDDEMKKCQKRIKNHNPNQLSIIKKEEQKIETSLSVAQIALFFRVFNQTGVFTNKVLMEMFKVLGEKLTSKRTSNISIESLHTKYYQVEDRTKAAIREILTEAIRELDRLA